MPHDIDFWSAIHRLRKADGRFQPEAYQFVIEALEYTIQQLGERRHVLAEELLGGFSAYARSRFGILAGDVLTKWGVSSALDVGAVVFQMVKAGVLARQDSDRLEDFDRGFDLKRSLAEGYFE